MNFFQMYHQNIYHLTFSIFWEKNDAADYFDLSKAKQVTMPNLSPTKASASIDNNQYWDIALKGSILELNGV